ncbi:hypothetical protein LHYA1_G002149 [Lachnellula hyalina]|uniref:Uncharacterized protein n=1 Tax=Lachnellula hyalina TaxID=1316788 RepID=A0A8H8R755_9HELO|nr:uncharacterized protein LHYA1_G002149 [Lachnellula hyalina]TVY28770.1 hypothetical protein LHYA1_G002149 [Lachnellula hyalina]
MFILPKIIFNLSLILSLHVALLGLIFTNNTFLAPSLILAKRISKLDIPPSYKQLLLYLKPEIANIPINTFIKYYLRRIVTANTRAIISSYKP